MKNIIELQGNLGSRLKAREIIIKKISSAKMLSVRHCIFLSIAIRKKSILIQSFPRGVTN